MGYFSSQCKNILDLISINHETETDTLTLDSPPASNPENNVSQSTQNKDLLIPNLANDSGDLMSIDYPKKPSLINQLKSPSNKNIKETALTTIKCPTPSSSFQPPSPKPIYSTSSPLTMKPPNVPHVIT